MAPKVVTSEALHRWRWNLVKRRLFCTNFHPQWCKSRAGTSKLKNTHTHTTVLWPSWILSGTTRVSRHQKGKTRKVNQYGFTGARDSEWQWHQLGYMQICTLTQTQNHASIPPLIFLQCLPATQPSTSKHWRHDPKIENVTQFQNRNTPQGFLCSEIASYTILPKFSGFVAVTQIKIQIWLNLFKGNIFKGLKSYKSLTWGVCFPGNFQHFLAVKWYIRYENFLEVQ